MWHAAPVHVQARPQTVIAAVKIERRLAAGIAVDYSHVVVRGTLRLHTVRAPLVLRDSVVTGSVIAESTEFPSVVDLSGSTIKGRLVFPEARFDGPVLLLGKSTHVAGAAQFAFADFAGPAVFAGTSFDRRASFAGCQFHGESRFERIVFGGPATFAFASFDHVGDFRLTNFSGAASFARAEFRSPSDFSFTSFNAVTSFAGVRFFAPADFTASLFSAGSGKRARPASFADAHFGGGGIFNQSTFMSGGYFAQADASGDLEFEEATLLGNMNFSTTRFLAAADFDDATFHGTVDFDQAQLADLTLDGAQLETSTLLLPAAQGQTEGGLDQIRMDPNDVSRIQLLQGSHPRSAQEHALALIETAARSGGDLQIAADAGVRRLTLERHDENHVLQVVNWLVYWEIAGYFLRWWHPLIAILILIALATLIRSRRAWRGQTSTSNGVGRIFLAIAASVGAVWRGPTKEQPQGDDAQPPAAVVGAKPRGRL